MPRYFTIAATSKDNTFRCRLPPGVSRLRLLPLNVNLLRNSLRYLCVLGVSAGENCRTTFTAETPRHRASAEKQFQIVLSASIKEAGCSTAQDRGIRRVFFTLIVAAIVKYHGTSPWHLSTLAQGIGNGPLTRIKHAGAALPLRLPRQPVNEQ